MQMDDSVNVFGEKLGICGVDPITGFYRDGACNTCKDDFGSHTVCIETSKDFLDYSKSKGNDLTTPVPAFNFKGLNPGDSWCMCWEVVRGRKKRYGAKTPSAKYPYKSFGDCAYGAS